MPTEITQSTTGKKREADDGDAAQIAPTKRVKRVEAVIDQEEKDSEEEDSVDDDEDAEEGTELSPDVQDRLSYCESKVEMLTKSYLKDVMKGLSGFYGSRSGTNKFMAASIIGHLEQQARECGSDLREEKSLIRSVYRRCYGGCGDDGDSDADSGDD